MRTLAHISDLHFGTEDEAVVRALVADLRRVAPDLVIVSGDLTQRARTAQFEAARAFLQDLGMPVLAVPGNHDAPLFDVARRLVAPFARFHRFIEPVEMPSWSDGEVAVLGVNTARRTAWKEGRISWDQVRAARRWFLDQGARTKILVTHHPFLPRAESPRERIVGRAGEVLAALATCEVDLVLSGHLHVHYSGDAADHHLTLARGILVAQAGTAVSRRVRAMPNAYNVVRVASPRVEIEVRRFDGRAFCAEKVSAWRRDAQWWRPQPLEQGMPSALAPACDPSSPGATG